MPDSRFNTQPNQSWTAELWSFALRCYTHEKDHLLRLQDTAQLHINDALTVAFADAKQLELHPACWDQVRSGRPRQVLLRLRRLRQTLNRSDPGRPLALDWELTLEQWDLARLANCLSPVNTAGEPGTHTRTTERAIAAISEHSALSVNQTDTLIMRLVRSTERAVD